MNTTHHFAVIEQALNFIAANPLEQPSLSAVARHCQLSETHLQRVFTAFAGVSPKQFLQQLNRQTLKNRLMSGDSLLDASEQAGLSSPSRGYDVMVKLEAISPGELKSAGAGLQFWVGVHDCLLGRCLLVSTARGIHQLAFIDNDHQLEQTLNQLKQQWPQASISQDNSVTEPLLALLFDRQQSQQQVSLWLQGSAFQIKVWEALLSIPAGQVCSYAALAQAIEQPKAARAVGSAIGKNPVAILIPCHRVIQQLGTIGGYRWGTTRKQALLGREACRGITEQSSAD